MQIRQEVRETRSGPSGTVVCRSFRPAGLRLPFRQLNEDRDGSIVRQALDEVVDEVAQARPADDLTGPRRLVAARPDDRRRLGKGCGHRSAEGRCQSQTAGPEGAESLGRALARGDESPQCGIGRIRAEQFDRRFVPDEADGGTLPAHIEGAVADLSEEPKASGQHRRLDKGGGRR